jgi:hypothetical protein
MIAAVHDQAAAKERRLSRVLSPHQPRRRNQSRMLGASGTFFQFEMLSAMIFVDCIAA